MDENFPPRGLTFEPPFEIFHLSGGLGLLLGANRQAWLMSPDTQGATFFSMLPGAPIREIFNDQGNLRFLGRNRFQDASQMNDPIPGNFSIAAESATQSCLAEDQSILWSGISNSLHHNQRNSDAILAIRLQRQIRISTARLERLSTTYRTVLIATTSGPVTDGDNYHLTNDKYAHWLGSEYRSCINELYSLRDAILAAYFRLLLKREDPFSIKKLRSAALEESDKASALITQSMFCKNGDLLIDHMSLYRSIALHCIGATNPLFGDIYQRRISKGPYGEIPYLVFPLYDNVEAMRELEQGSSKGIFQPFDRSEAERFGRLSKHLDALEFSYDCFVRLLLISQYIAENIGITPKTLTITDEDIIEATITDADGKVTTIRRDETTGKLVEH